MKRRGKNNRFNLIISVIIIGFCLIPSASMQEAGHFYSVFENENITSNMTTIPENSRTVALNESATNSIALSVEDLRFIPLLAINTSKFLFGKTWIVSKEGLGGYKDIQSAVNAASPGDIVEVHSGTYQEQVRVDKSLTLQGLDTGKGIPIISGGDYLGTTAVTLSADGVAIRGFLVTYSEKGVEVNSNNNTIEGNSINDTYLPIEIVKSRGNVIRDNLVYDSDFGIMLRYSSGNSIISNTITSRDGIALSRSDNNLIKNNNVLNNKFNGISITGSSHNLIEGNVARNNGHRGIGLFGSSNNIIRHNGVSGNGWCNICIDSMCGENTIEGNTDNNVTINDDPDVVPLKEEPRMDLAINSVPNGAEIWIDGLNTGKKTPSKVSFNKPGKHTYRLRLKNFEPSEGELNIPKSGNIRAELKKQT
jgi:parallel beta-helix repeat protein